MQAGSDGEIVDLVEGDDKSFYVEAIVVLGNRIAIRVNQPQNAVLQHAQYGLKRVIDAERSSDAEPVRIRVGADRSCRRGWHSDGRCCRRIVPVVVAAAATGLTIVYNRQ